MNPEMYSTSGESSTKVVVVPAPQTTVIHAPVPQKRLCDAYILCFPLGFLGLHHFYLRRPGFGVLYLFTFGLLGVGWLSDLVRMPVLVKECNAKLANPALKDRKSLHDAYVLWFPMGLLLGFHHFYLRRWGWGILYMCTVGLFGIGWLIDGCRMKLLVDQANRKHEERQAQGPILHSLTDNYVLTLVPITGLLGVQHYNLGRTMFGFLYTCTLGVLGVGWLLDVCRMSCLVSDLNKQILEGRPPKKRVDDTYILAFPLGFLGLHHYYLGRYGWGVLYTLTFGLLGVGWLLDLLRIPCLVADYNKRVENERLITGSVISGSQGYTNAVAGSVTVITTTTGTPVGAHPGVYAGQPPQVVYPPQGQLPAYTSQAQGAGVYPQVPPYQASQTGYNSLDSIVSSEVGHEQPPSYDVATSGLPPKCNEGNQESSVPSAPPKGDL